MFRFFAAFASLFNRSESAASGNETELALLRRFVDHPKSHRHPRLQLQVGEGVKMRVRMKPGVRVKVTIKASLDLTFKVTVEAIVHPRV